MLRAFLLAALLLLAPGARAQQLMQVISQDVHHASGPACGGYTGPGDVDSNFNQFWGMRAYNASSCGLKLFRVIDETTTTQTDITSSSTNGLPSATDLSGAGCGSHVCKFVTFYGYGSSPVDITQATDADRATLTANCVNTSLYCATFATNGDYSSGANITVNNAQVLYFVAKQTATDGSNREIMAGANGGGTNWAEYQTSDHPGCFEGGSELSGTVSIGTWARALCTNNAASSALLENGTNHTGTLTSSTATGPAHVGNSNFVGTWVESGINSTTMGSTLSTLDSNIHTQWNVP